MRIIFGEGYTDDEKRGFINIIYQNIYEATYSLICEMKSSNTPYENSDNLVNLLIINQLNIYLSILIKVYMNRYIDWVLIDFEFRILTCKVVIFCFI